MFSQTTFLVFLFSFCAISPSFANALEKEKRSQKIISTSQHSHDRTEDSWCFLNLESGKFPPLMKLFPSHTTRYA